MASEIALMRALDRGASVTLIASTLGPGDISPARSPGKNHVPLGESSRPSGRTLPGRFCSRDGIVARVEWRRSSHPVPFQDMLPWPLRQKTAAKPLARVGRVDLRTLRRYESL